MTEETSPLGRYDTPAKPARGEPLHEVQLLGLPVKLLAAGREHHDELMHEFRLLALAPGGAGRDVPARLVELTDILGVRYAQTGRRPESEVDTALALGVDTVDLTYHVPEHVVDAANRLEALMAEADEFCRAQRLLTLARPPVLVRFSHWYLEQFRRQIGGLPPEPWDGPTDL